MKYSAVLLAAVFAAGASAQITRADFPACALPCLQTAITSETNCAVDDINCSCEPANNKLITAAATPCVIQSCEGDDLSKTLDVSGKICAEGNDNGGGSGEDTSSSTTVETSTSTKVEETTTKATETSTKVETTTSATIPVGGPSTVYVTVCDSSSTKKAPTPSGNATAPVVPPTFTGAAVQLGAGLGSVAAFALAALAL